MHSPQMNSCALSATHIRSLCFFNISVMYISSQSGYGQICNDVVVESVGLSGLGEFFFRKADKLIVAG